MTLLNNFLRHFRTALTFILLFTLMACTSRGCSSRKDIPPEDQLYSYITTAVNVTRMEQRQELTELATGPLKAALVNASDDSFKKAYIDKRYDFRTFEIIQRKEIEDKNEIMIDFRLVYRSWQSGEPEERAPVIDTTNRAFLVYEHGRWAIARIENVESSYDWEVGLPLDNVSTAGVKPEDAPKEIKSSRELSLEQDQASQPQPQVQPQAKP